MLDIKQGGLANSAGNTLESTVIATLTSKGFTVVSHKEYIKHPEHFGQEVLLLNVPFTTMYGHSGKTEFLLSSERHQLKIRIECKWQQSSGSVDEKIPYLYLNCIENMPEQKIFIIMDGGGAKQGAIAWLKRACQEKLYTTEVNRYKEVDVMNLMEFLSWTNKNLR